MTNDRFKVHNIINFGGKYLYANDKGTSQYHTICDKFVIKLYKLTAVILCMICASFGLAGLSGLYAIIFVDHRYTFLGMELPFVDSSNSSGYLILLMYQTIVAFIFLVSSVAIEIGVVLVHNAFDLLPALIHLRSNELSSEINVNGRRSVNVLMRFRNICIQVQDFNS